ncbi:DUF3558 domain-containing protein [Amycolatopsis mediterranei]|uniref:DUF3558 domain-containing protein n=1 Tax=Amycolatopsis mediterranei TaxID=33910 RepID=UPI0008FFC828|nr:DUF3558 domain-containing protein [Amycolatopsis mediterranei]UZF72935.1 DUF3558 domain-containing protein [Amycolatopsis mediterranei]
MNRRRLFAVLSVVGLVVACSPRTGNEGGTSGSALPVSPGKNAVSSALPYAGAPKVPDPLPVSVLSGDPCADALTHEQVVAAVGVDVPGKRGDLAQIGPGCTWFNRDTGGAVGVSYTINTHVGLSGVYANTQPQSAVWKELPPVQGFPAVAYAGNNGGAVPEGFCQASIGLADSFSVDVSLTLGSSKRHTEDACSLITQIADMTVTTLKAKAGS